jgi:nucleoside-diphosphate-sugar epimerase
VAAEQVCFEYISKGLDVDIIRPRTVVGAGRLGIFDILFDWISRDKNIYIIGKGNNAIQFLHTEDLALCCHLSSLHQGSETYNVGSREFAPLREDLNHLIRHAATRSRIISLPVLPTIALLAILDKLRLSPLASWHYLTYHKDFYFTNEKAGKVLGWKPRYGNKELLTTAYDDYLKMRATGFFKYGGSHRKALKQGLLGFLRRIS